MEAIDIKDIRLAGIVVGVALLLLITYLAMKFSTGVNWTTIDFLAAGTLLLSSGLACEFVLRNIERTFFRLAICAAILLALFVVWAELAVGLIGTPFTGS